MSTGTPWCSPGRRRAVQRPYGYGGPISSDLQLRPLTHGDTPALAALFLAAGATLAERLGRPPDPAQAAADLEAALGDEGRFVFGIFLGPHLIGLVDARLAAESAGMADIGLLVLAPQYDDPAVAALALRILARWLAGQFGVQQLETLVPAHLAAELAFWRSQGFELTGEQVRRTTDAYAPRMLVLRLSEFGALW